MIVLTLLATESKRGRGNWLDLVDIVSGIVCVLHEGIRWRALPTVFGRWQSVYSRFYRGRSAGSWRVFGGVATSPRKGTMCSLDASYIKVHEEANVAPPENEAMGVSLGGRTTKIHGLTDSAGHAAKLKSTGGNVADCTVAPDMLHS